MPYKLIKEFNKILKGDEIFTIRGPMSPLLLAFQWQDEKIPLELFTINKGRDSFMVLSEKNYFEIARRRFAEYYAGTISLQDLQNEYNFFANGMQAFYDRIMLETDLSMMTDEALADVFKEILALFLEPLQKTIYIECIDYDKILGVIGADKKAMLDEIWETATHPTFMSFEGRRLKFLLDLVSADLNNASAVFKARFIFTDYVWTKKDDEIRTALADIKKEFQRKTEEYEKLLQNVEVRKQEYELWKKMLSPDAQKIVEYMQLVMLFRDIRKDVIAQLQATMVVLSEEMLRRVDIDVKHAPNVLILEYEKGVRYLKDSAGNIEKRENGFISIVYTDGTYKAELCDFSEAFGEFEATIANHVHTDTIKGQIANKGKHTGIVRIVLDPHGYEGFNQGDVLVTSMTRPEFVQLMRQAGAVVTNEGGITCHAAIVSRELNIPCIIGTKIATRVLKDGDMVEADADNGIVRILRG